MSNPQGDEQTSSGQVSEVSGLDPESADTPIAPEDATAGYPDSESGAPDEGEEVGPNARTGDEHTDDGG